MGGTGSSAVAPSSAEAVLARLDDPATAAALHQLLDSLPTLALLVRSVEDLLARSEVIVDNLSDGWAELRDSATSGESDLARTAGELRTLIPALARATPAINRVLDSGIVEPEPVGVLSEAAESIVDGLERARLRTGGGTYRTVVRRLRDPDVKRGILYALDVVQSFGRRLSAR